MSDASRARSDSIASGGEIGSFHGLSFAVVWLHFVKMQDSSMSSTAVNSGEGDSLSPPMWVGAIAEKCVHQRVVELAGTYQIIA